MSPGKYQQTEAASAALDVDSSIPVNSSYKSDPSSEGSSQYAVSIPSSSLVAMPTAPKMGDPGPVGLVAFGITTIMLNFSNAGVSESGAAGLVMSYGIFHGGFVQLIAGVFEMIKGNTFAAVAFLSYGGFWMGLALFDLLELSEQLNAGSIKDGKCVWLVTWGIFTLAMWLNTFRLNRALQFVFGTLTLLFIFLAGGQYNTTVLKIGGWIGIVCGFSALFTGIAEVTNAVHEREVLPLGRMNKKSS